MHAHTHLAGILAGHCDIYRDRTPPFSVYSWLLRVGRCNAYISQAAKDARASQDTLIDVFERVEMYLRRLEIYTEVPATMEMMDILVRIMVEVLSILGLAMKEIKQGRMSKYVQYKYENVDRRMFRKISE